MCNTDSNDGFSHYMLQNPDNIQAKLPRQQCCPIQNYSQNQCYDARFQNYSLPMPRISKENDNLGRLQISSLGSVPVSFCLQGIQMYQYSPPCYNFPCSQCQFKNTTDYQLSKFGEYTLPIYNNAYSVQNPPLDYISERYKTHFQSVPLTYTENEGPYPNGNNDEVTNCPVYQGTSISTN